MSRGSRYVTVRTDSVPRSFYVVANQPFMASDKGDHCIDLLEGDIFLITYFNKLGYWWGVSVYDLDRQGWIPSSLVQPYTGEVPDEAISLREKLADNYKSKKDTKGDEKKGVETVVANPESVTEFNIVNNDSSQFEEYESVAFVSREGRKVLVGDSDRARDRIDEGEEDFDYEAWAESKQKNQDSPKRSRIK